MSVVPMRASQQGWVWDGCSWVWDPSCCPPSGGCCPPCPPTPLPPPPLQGPIIGVTDGSDAQPGQVGEFVQASSSFAYAAYPNNTPMTTSLAILQPGDWDCQIVAQPTNAVDFVEFFLQPIPIGVTGIHGGAGAGAIGSFAPGTVQNYFIAIGSPFRASISVPTLIPVFCQVNCNVTTGLVAGTLFLDMFARRRR